MASQNNDEGKIITILRQRRAIEELIQRLIEARSEEEVQEILGHIVEQGEQVTPTLIANLDTTDPHLRGALGVVARALPPAEIVPALRAAALDSSLSDHARLTAALILERFLDESLAMDSLLHIQDPTQVALQSVQEVIEESRSSRAIVIDYIKSMQEQPLDVQHMVLDALEYLLQEEEPVELLRTLAQGTEGSIAARAIDMLGRLRIPPSAHALHILLPTIHPDRRPLLERGLRKLQFAGVPVEPLPPPATTWRTLVGAVDGRGNQSIWFLKEDPASGHASLLGLHLNCEAGILEAWGDDHLKEHAFPPPAPAGTLHPIPMRPHSLPLHFLEAPFDYGRYLVLEALQIHWREDRPVPLEYALYNDMLWGYDTAGLADAKPQLPLLSEERFQTALEGSPDLLNMPDLFSWIAYNKAVLVSAHRIRTLAGSVDSVAVPRQWLVQLANTSFEGEEIRAAFIGRLRRLSEWLWLAGRAEAAQQALAAAIALEDRSPGEHPFVIALIQRGLEFAITALSQGMDLDAGAGDSSLEQGFSLDQD